MNGTILDGAWLLKQTGLYNDFVCWERMVEKDPLMERILVRPFWRAEHASLIGL